MFFLISVRPAVFFASLSIGLLLLPRPATAQTTPPESTPALLKMPVRGGSLALKVTDFVAARQLVIDAAAKVGAEVMGGKTFVIEKGRKHGYVHLRLSTERLPQLLPMIRPVGTLASDDLSTTEQVSNYEDLGRRIERLRKHQSRLDELLHSRRNLRGSDILYVQERLFRAGVDEEQLQQARLDMERQSRMAQITVTMFEPLPIIKPVTPIVAAQNSFAHWFDNGKRRAQWRRDQLMARIATGLAFALVYAPIWLPLSIIGLLLLRAIWQRRGAISRTLGEIAKRGKSILRNRHHPITTVAATIPSLPNES